jgi:hypothetical protein
VSEVDNIAKSSAVVGEAEGGGLHLEVEYDQKKLSVCQMRGWANLLIGSAKKIWLRV